MEKLRPHQQAPYRALLEIFRQHRTALDLSVMGSGKTYVAAAVAIALKKPTLVVCPKIAEGTWRRAAEHFGDSFSVVGYEKLRAGNTPFGKWQNDDRTAQRFFRCAFCQCVVDPAKPVPCYCHPAGIHCVEVKKKPVQYGAFSVHPAVRHIIFDEVHRCGALDSLNADLLIAAKKSGASVLGLSATVATSPLGLRAIGHLVDLHNLDTDSLLPRLPSFARWARGHGCRKDPVFHGWKWFAGAAEQAEIMAQIRAQIIPARGVRVTEADIPDFPDVDITAELYTLDSPEKIDGCYGRMFGAVETLRARTADYCEGPLTEILKARQEVEILKVPIAQELAQDYLAKGFSVGIFVNFRQTIDELQKLFPEAKVIDGQTDNRDAVVAAFQRNDCRLLIINSEAGGVCLSLHDLDGSHPRAGVVFPGFSAVTLRQLLGRFRRDGGKSCAHYRLVFADGTVEMPVYRALRPKLNNLDALNDADLKPDNLKLCSA